MKKLMIAAAIAAMGAGAFADCIDPDEPITANCAAVYNVSVSVKTLASKARTVKVECEDDLAACYLISGSRKYAGLIASCDCTCDEGAIVADAATYFWSTSLKVGYCDALITLANAVRFGGATTDKATKVGATVEITAGDIALTGAGFGTADVRNLRIKTISGYIAGLVDAPVCSQKCEDPLPAYGFMVCDYEPLEGVTQVPAYGTWNVKYNAAASKKYAANSGYIASKLLPAYYVTQCVLAD